MIDMKPTIEAKSDQLNSDDLIGGPITVKITAVKTSDTKEQPISINYEGDRGKPYKPCKSMRRVLVAVWGDDGQKYVGQSMTLFRDEKVLWAGEPVGGIRISHMTGLEAERKLSLTQSRGSKKPWVVKPLRVAAASAPSASAAPSSPAEAELRALATKIKDALVGAQDSTDLWLLWDDKLKPDLDRVKEQNEKTYEHLASIYEKRRQQLEGGAA